MKKTVLALSLVSIVTGSWAGCAHLAGSNGQAGDTRAAVLDAYFPLAVGNRWTYQTFFQGQAQPDLVVKIIEHKGGFFIDDRPHPGRMKIDGEGIRDGSVRYLLKAPLKKGNKWMSVADVRTVEHYEIIAVDKEIRVPAGVFKGCVVVRMEVRISEKRSMVNKMFFAPHAGIIEIAAGLKDGARIIPQTKMLLKSFELAPAGTSEKP